jgi:hypothetical protein
MSKALECGVRMRLPSGQKSRQEYLLPHLSLPTLSKASKAPSTRVVPGLTSCDIV